MAELSKKDIKEIFVESLEPFANSVQKEFQRIGQRFESIDQRFESIDQRFESIDQRFGSLEKDVKKIKSEMVTKSYLDDKLADLEGNIIVRQRKQDQKVNRLIEILQTKNVLQDDDITTLQEFQIFPTSQ